jgi:DNA-binding NarL/FixJ family response regulator
MSAIRILIIEDHAATLDGLTLGLSREEDIEVVGSSENSDEGLALARQLKPDVIVLDLHLPGSLSPRSMVDVFTALKDSRLIIFSAENRLALVQAILAMGVSAYLLKTERVSTLATIIRRVMAGESAIMSQQLKSDCSKITKAEEEILSMLADGLRYQEIADARLTAASTVRKQCDMLQLKLQLESREQLITWAVRNGYGNLEQQSQTLK